MYNDNISLYQGNLAADPEVTFGDSGRAKATFTVFVNNSPSRNAQAGEEPKSHAIRVTAWGDLANNVASLKKGTRVGVLGHIDSYEMQGIFDEQGQPLKRTGFSVIAEDIMPSLRWATAVVTKNARGNGNGGSNTAAQGGQARQGQAQAQGRPAQTQPAASGDDEF